MRLNKKKPNITKKINVFCVSFLNNNLYYVPSNFMHQPVLKHISLVLMSLTLLIMSLVSAKDAGLYLFFFHFLSLAYKLCILRYKRNNFDLELSQQKTKASQDTVITPYHLRYKNLTIILSMLMIIMLMTLFKVISNDTLYIIAVWTSIIVTFIQQLFDGLITIYHAEVQKK